jgi:hypothetical protein
MLLYRTFLLVLTILIICSWIANVTAKPDMGVEEQFCLRLKVLTEVFVNYQIDEQKLSEVWGIAPTISEDNQYWIVPTNGYRTKITANELGSDPKASELSIYPDHAMRVQFRHMVAVFGEWKKVHQSKTSSVRFLYSSHQLRKAAKIYVHLASPPNDPASTVFLIKIRRVSSYKGKD